MAINRLRIPDYIKFFILPKALSFCANSALAQLSILKILKIKKTVKRSIIYPIGKKEIVKENFYIFSVVRI